MNIVGKARAFVHSLEAHAKKTAWDWRKCPKCGKDDTIRYGTYSVHPWFLDGRHKLAIQRHYCQRCRKTYSEQSSYLVRGSWYAREVHRLGIDFWQHGRTSLRKDAELVRSLLGRQERWLIWRLFAPEPDEAQKCRFSKSTLYRWLDRTGEVAKGTVKGQLEGAKNSGQVGVDGLWARLRGTAEGKVKRVVLVLVDSEPPGIPEPAASRRRHRPR